MAKGIMFAIAALLLTIAPLSTSAQCEAPLLMGTTISGVAEYDDGSFAVTGIFSTITSADGSTTYTAKGTYDDFIARVEADGTVRWILRYGSTTAIPPAGDNWDESLRKPIILEDQTLLVAGTHHGAGALQSDWGTVATWPYLGYSRDAVIMRISPYGVLEDYAWIYGQGNEHSNDIAVFDGAVYLTGKFNGCCPTGAARIADFNGNTAGLANIGFATGYVVKFDLTTGAYQWAATVGSRDAWGFAMDASHQGVVVSFIIRGGSSYLMRTPGGNVTGPAFSNAIVAFSPSGHIQWRTHIQGQYKSYYCASMGYGVTQDGNDVLVYGGHYSPITAVPVGGGQTLALGYSGTSADHTYDAFAIRFNENGIPTNGISFGGANGYEIAYDAGVGDDGSIMLVGEHQTGFQLGSYQFAPAVGGYDGFAVTTSPSLIPQTAHQFTGTGQDRLLVAGYREGRFYRGGRVTAGVDIRGTTITGLNGFVDFGCSPRSLSMTYPQGGEEFCVGYPLTVTWTQTALTTVGLELSTDGGTTWTSQITGIDAADESYTWNVPSDIAGMATVQLRLVTDDTPVLSSGMSSSGTVATLPDMTLSVDPEYLWPPNNKMRDVEVNVTVSGGCSPTWELHSITSSDGDEINDVGSASVGTMDTEIELRAQREGNSDGRTYTITYLLEDGSIYETYSVEVVVPHDADDLAKGSAALDADFGQYATYIDQLTHDAAAATVSFRVHIAEAQQLSIELYTMTGQRVRSETALMSSGISVYTMDVSGLRAGGYLLRVVSGDHVFGASVPLW